jgi:hypothetical protein
MLLTELPEAILVYILSFLRLAPIANTLQCSAAMKSVGKDLTVWMNGIANSVAATFKCSADGWLKIALHHFTGNRKALFEDTRSRESRYRDCDPLVPHFASGTLLKQILACFVAILTDDEKWFASLIWNFPILLETCSTPNYHTNMICRSKSSVCLIYDPDYLHTLGNFITDKLSELEDGVCIPMAHNSDPVTICNVREVVRLVHAGGIKFKEGATPSKCPKIYGLVESSFWED